MYEFIIEGGREAAVRHDPYEGIPAGEDGWVGHADCAQDWDPCSCHGDRLCRLGMRMRSLRSVANLVSYLYTEQRGARIKYDVERAAADALGRQTGEFYSVSRDTRDKLNEVSGDVWRNERFIQELAREIWPLIVANARADRARVASDSRA